MDKKTGITSFTLKIVAIIAMTLDHIPSIFEPVLPEGIQCLFLLTGGITFPIMAFLITEGYRHTSNLKKYALRLGIFALVSQVPYWLFLYMRLNIMFTLLLGLLLVHLDKTMKSRVAFVAVCIAVTAASFFCDWCLIGPFVILLFAKLRDRKYGLVSACWFIALGAVVTLLATLPFDGTPIYACTMMSYPVGAIVNSLLLVHYNGERGRPLKYFFYIYYPGHIVVLALICFAITGQFPIPA